MNMEVADNPATSGKLTVKRVAMQKLNNRYHKSIYIDYQQQIFLEYLKLYDTYRSVST